MACKKFGGWMCNDSFFLQVKVANKLWQYRRNDNSGEKQHQLFFLGWYERPGKFKLYSFCIPFVNFSIGFFLKKRESRFND